ncbi:hypothetical protein FBZ85_12618 [Azospirillum brasilense]|nr:MULTISPECIES: hypothetical protein [Azospirillum]MBK3798702.1 hypothetical protein [Azospirillum argentinense]TWA69804.1 hypothetical protein FBZ85_12618 [Azospirillum brasilense]
MDGDPRHAARQLILETMMANEHLQWAGGMLVAAMAVWLALNGPQAIVLMSGEADFASFTIEPGVRPGVDVTFRFIAGKVPPVANDNRKETR